MIDRVRVVLRVLLALFFVMAGYNHFRNPGFYLRMIPPQLPSPELLNWVSGLAEILGGVGVLLSPLRRLAGVGLIVLLIAVFPANIYSAVAGINPMNPGGPTWVLWLRLPFQLVFCGWVYWTCLSRPQVARDS